FVLLINLFFFSSRRRHTRFSRDWSSDVCSSDLHGQDIVDRVQQGFPFFDGAVGGREIHHIGGKSFFREFEGKTGAGGVFKEDVRSEERRVGKECRTRW